jgi:hypothetical protein
MVCRIALFIAAIFSSSAIAQSPGPTPRPDGRANNQIRALEDENSRFDRLRSIEKLSPKSPPKFHPLLDRKTGIYRKASEEETRVLAVDESHISTYRLFLKQPGTGIVKLSGDSSCISDGDLVIAKEQCIDLKMPGAGTSFSFRLESYRLPRLADLVLFNGMFGADSVLQQFALVRLGEVDIEQVGMDSPGIKYLIDMQPLRDRTLFAGYDAEITKGIESGGFLYRKGHPVVYGATYALRSIAFRGKYLRSIDGVEYDEMDYDRRRDVIVVFRVVGLDSAGNATIVWKRLREIESPSLKGT